MKTIKIKAPVKLTLNTELATVMRLIIAGRIEARTYEKIPFEHEDETRLTGSSDETSIKRSGLCT